eukprot:6503736-Pyramimonas_sp.AAC.1
MRCLQFWKDPDSLPMIGCRGPGPSKIWGCVGFVQGPYAGPDHCRSSGQGNVHAWLYYARRLYFASLFETRSGASGLKLPGAKTTLPRILAGLHPHC